MIKRNRTTIILGSLAMLLPLAAGLVLWGRLPDTIAIHWNAEGVADGFSSKGFAALGLPLILLGAYWLCILITAADPKNKGQNQKVFRLVLWLVPVIALVACGYVLASAMGLELNISRILMVVIGIVIAAIGNYMPKCRQNYTIGIKVVWALDDEENWNATHRLAGRLWLAGGIVLALCALLPEKAAVWVLPALAALLVVVPMVYSYLFYRKKLKKQG